MKRIILLTAGVWIITISVLHVWLNLDLKWFRPAAEEQAADKFRVGFLPVT